MWLEIGIALAVPGVGAAYAIIRYFMKKEQCFTKMQNKINELSDHDKGSTDLHDGFDERLDKIEENQQKWIIFLKLLLDERKIKYSD